ncbi:response regulator [bacterium]|nr:MAG: response regulator [bacterium]
MSRRTALIVEDNPDDERLTIRALDRLELDVDYHVVRDGVEAVTYLRSCSELPCLVLLDVKLPLMTGHEVLEEIRSDVRLNHLPVVFFTSSDDPKDIAAAYRNRVNGYVQKPVDFDEFASRVRVLGRYWLTDNIAAIRECAAR